MFIRNPTGSRLDVGDRRHGLADDAAEQVGREVHQPQDELDDDLDHDGDELDDPARSARRTARRRGWNAPIGSSRSSSDSVSQMPEEHARDQLERDAERRHRRLDAGRGLADDARLGELLVGRLAAGQQRDEPADEVLGGQRDLLAGERVLRR